MRLFALSLAVVLSGVCINAVAAPLNEVPFNKVHVDDQFWSARLEANRKNTCNAIYEQLQKTGRIDNFSKTAGMMKGDFVGAVFNDSDVYKWLEGASYILTMRPDTDLEAKIDDVITKVAAAQQSDGYLNTYFTLKDPNGRWKDIRLQHELYCAGHLFEAAVAHYQATGKRTLLDVAIKYADYIDSVFGWNKRHEVPGHEEIELALVKLYNVTGEKRYLDLSEFFLKLRGTDNGRKHWGDLQLSPDFKLDGQYHQDHLPIEQHTTIVGHAVRAMYLYCAVSDILRYREITGYRQALDRVWDDMVASKMYITGGIGSTGGTEGFTSGYDLPNEAAYAETCAAIGEAFLGHRLNMLHADARYADVMERVLYNNVLAGASLDGTRFFYTNALESKGNVSRSDFFGCACCPPNWMRIVASLGSYIYTSGENEIYANLYLGNTAEIKLGQNTIKIRQQTSYPWDGRVKFTMQPKTGQEFALKLRIPQWCRNYNISVNKQPLTQPEIIKGYACLTRKWQSGDVIELEMDMPITLINANPKVVSDKNRIALQRGPLVYCLEGVDNDFDLNKFILPIGSGLSTQMRKDLLGGVTVINADGWVLDQQNWANSLYQPQNVKKVSCIAVPYYAWCNRKQSQMLVWIRQAASE